MINKFYPEASFWGSEGRDFYKRDKGIRRPADPFQWPPDYLLDGQYAPERSSVLLPSGERINAFPSVLRTNLPSRS